MNPPPSSPTALLAHALGWTLLHFVWQGVLVALILACVLALLSRRSAQPRYLAACAALVLMTILPVITFTRIVAAERNAANTFLVSIPLSITVTDHGLANPPDPLLFRIATSLDHSVPAMLAIWLAGVVLLSLRLGIGLLVAQRMMSAATQPVPRDLLTIFQRLARRIGVTRPVRLLHSALVQVPTVIGWLRPVVLVPLSCLSGLSPTQVEAILAHELAHILRHDYLVSVLQSIVEALLFYHPAVWWVSRHIRREREHCCDDLAVQFTGDPLTYARALSLLEEHRSALPAIALGANGGILTMRIRRLLDSKQSPATSQLAALALLGIVIAATAVCVGTAARAQSNRSPQSSSALASVAVSTDAIHSPALQQQPGADPAISIEYQHWIDEDVRWLIAPEERAAFLQLNSDPERDHFIQQFWERRNSAGSAPGSYRVEHYRRIAYANQHFAAAGIPGWETGRGRMYIVNGAPNSIDTQSTTAAEGHSSEIWRYASAPTSGQGTGTKDFRFVDLCNCGNYQLSAPAPANSAASSSNSQPRNFSSSARPQNIEKKPTVQNVSYRPASISQQAPAQPPLPVAARIMAGQIITRVNPIYPPDAKADHVEGAVVLHAVISKTGVIEHLEVVSGPVELRTSAIDAIRQWIYRPYLLNGQPTEVETTITVNYKLGDQSDSENDDSATSIVPRKIGNGISAPVLTYSVPPQYPEQAKKDKTEGIVLVQLWVDEQGRPGHVRVLRGAGKGFDEKAVAAVKQYKFNPALEAGKPVPVELNLEVNFKIF